MDETPQEENIRTLRNEKYRCVNEESLAVRVLVEKYVLECFTGLSPCFNNVKYCFSLTRHTQNHKV